MKSIIKLVLVVFLFSSVAFAEGEMGNGGKPCPAGTTCLTEPTEPTEGETKTTESTDSTDTTSILTVVQEYLDSMLKYLES